MKTYIIAEAGVNHNGSIELAKKLVDIAVDAGADAVKFQTFRAEDMVSVQAPKATYQKDSTNQLESQFDMLKKLELDNNNHKYLIDYCQMKKIHFLSTPFDFKSADLLESLSLPIIKISSGDLTNAPLLLKIARTDRKIILSTGMSTLGEIEQALGVLAFGFICKIGNPSKGDFEKSYASEDGQRLLRENVTLLHCTTEYPAPFHEINLNVIDTLKRAFCLAVGYSDHSQGISVPIAAVAKGASVIEKHFTIDRTLPGPDHKASLEPKELKLMVQSIREVELALGTSIKRRTQSEIKNLEIARKSLVADKLIQRGMKFSEDNLFLKRPGTGLSPYKYWDLLGKEASKTYTKDEVIK